MHVACALATLVVHVVPQAPQLSGSIVVSTHVPEQSIGVADGHPLTHVEFEQIAVAPGHAWPHVPQLFGSLVVWMHAPLHAV